MNVLLNEKVKDTILEKIHLVSQEVIPEYAFLHANVSLDAYLDQISQRLVFSLQSFILGMPKERIDVEEAYPEDWWQAVRDRWFPRWWLRRWPVRRKTISIHQTIYRVCPHLNINIRPYPDKVHFAWLEEKE